MGDADDVQLCAHSVAEGHLTPYGTGVVHGIGVGALGVVLLLILLYAMLADGVAKRRLVIVIDGRDNPRQDG